MGGVSRGMNQRGGEGDRRRSQAKAMRGCDYTQLETAIRIFLETILPVINLREAEGLHFSQEKLRLRVKTQVEAVCGMRSKSGTGQGHALTNMCLPYRPTQRLL